MLEQSPEMVAFQVGLSQFAFGRRFGREKSKMLWNQSSNIQKLKVKCLVLFYFVCKWEYLEDLEYIFDVLESLWEDKGLGILLVLHTVSMGDYIIFV